MRPARKKGRGDYQSQTKDKHTKQKINQKKQDLADKIFPVYDSYKPDTENNKRRFKEHLQTDVSEDVKNIYCYADFMGIDYKIMIAFNCDSSTINRIVNSKDMRLSETKDHGLFIGSDLSWWNQEVIEKIKPLKQGKEYEYWEFLGE